MTKTLLAVDDSATMRKVLEITFSSDDFRVVTAEGAQAALAKMNEEPSVILIDTVLGKDDGYALCAEVRRRDPRATLVLLSSRHNPYDAARGRDAGADDYSDKPFDTQQLIDKVKKAIVARASAGDAPRPVTAAPVPVAAAAPPARAPQPTPAAAAPPPPAHPPAPIPGSSPAARPGAAPVAAPARPDRARARTLMFGDAAGGPADDVKPPTPQPPPVAQPSPSHTKPSAAIYPPSRAAPAAAPTPKPAAAAPGPKPAAAPPPSPAPQAAVAASVNGHLAGKLGELGLSSTQVDAVMALSRAVVEQVVWEVVPQLAEALIKEEIARLTREA